MNYHIDQSGKIEQTNKNTILCLSNDSWEAVIIKARTKRQLQEIFRRNGQIRNYVLFSFCAGLAILLNRNKKIGKVFIDREYPGKEGIIKEILLKILIKEKVIPQIYFAQIGKRSLAHHRAHAVGLGKLKAKKVISFKEIFAEIKMTEVLRLKNA